IRNNTASGSGSDGGGIYNQSTGTLNLQNSTVSHNVAGDDGGGIRNDGSLSVLNSTLHHNAAQSASSATSGGGGLINAIGATATITNSTFSTNTALNGGAIRNDGTLTLGNSTITNNTATGDVGGLGNSFNPLTGAPIGRATLQNSIIAGNIDARIAPYNLPDIGGGTNSFTDNGNNLIGAVDAFNSSINPTTQTGTAANPLNPLLAPLGDYGGSTLTHALLPGSRAIDAGHSSGAPATDQRGINRGGIVDIGAFESRGFSLTPLSGNNQVVNPGNAFPTSLSVSISSDFSEPVNGGTITFTAPGSGASANLTTSTATIASGQASTDVTANSTAGPYGVSAGGSGIQTPVNFNLRNNALPTGTVTITGTAAQGQTLTITNTLADADGLGPMTYQWQANGEDIAGATSNTFVLTQAQVGKTITVKARYTDALGAAESVTSAATGTVANVNDAPTGTVTLTGTATQGQTLTAANTLADVDGLGTITYQWQADGADISGATNSTLVLGQAQVGKTISVKARYTDAQGTNESVTSAATSAVANLNDLPRGNVNITGTLIQGETLTAANTLADIDGLGAITYQWQADGEDIDGETNSTLVLTQAQVGKTVTVKARYTDGQGTAESVASATTPAVANVNDLPTGTITITGTLIQGQTLTTANTLADLDGLGEFSYEWQQSVTGTGGWTTIADANSPTLTLTTAQIGYYIQPVVKYTDGGGALETVFGTPTASL
ncbi:MAG: hypothetical protein HC929_16260, partial [Leptolyngbyaceae cyanobacterium SM2_5_2]|nr:hypothetical protein [Leptolyngbyaceae cyanobacterium SM2_5_2]